MSSIHLELTSMVKEGRCYTSTRRPSFIVGSYANSLPFDFLNYLRYTKSCRRRNGCIINSSVCFVRTSKLFQNINLAPITPQSIVLAQMTPPQMFLSHIMPPNIVVVHIALPKHCPGTYYSSQNCLGAHYTHTHTHTNTV